MSGLPSASYCIHSYSACAAPCAMPPCCWPATSSGLRMRPQSSTATWRSIVTSPVSVSTSTTDTCAPNGNVESVPSKSSSCRSGAGSRPSGSLDASRDADGQLGPRQRPRRAHRPRAGRRRRRRCRRREASSRWPAMLPGPGEHLVRRDVDRAARGLQRTRAHRAGAARHAVGVGVDEA